MLSKCFEDVRVEFLGDNMVGDRPQGCKLLYGAYGMYHVTVIHLNKIFYFEGYHPKCLTEYFPVKQLLVLGNVVNGGSHSCLDTAALHKLDVP